MPTIIKVNREQKLYVMPCGEGYSCLGFQVCEDRQNALADEMALPRPGLKLGTVKHYNAYRRLVEIARKRNEATGWRSTSELTPQLVGLEGKRVEIVDKYGDTRRFYVGKSTGWIPCHLEIKRRNSTGGGAVYGAPFTSVKVVGSRF